MIIAHATHMDGFQAISMLKEMKKEKVKPDEITFLGILYACCRNRLVEKDFEYFHSMTDEYDIVPSIKYYGCMVDLLGRAEFVWVVRTVCEIIGESDMDHVSCFRWWLNNWLYVFETQNFNGLDDKGAWHFERGHESESCLWQKYIKSERDYQKNKKIWRKKKDKSTFF